MTSSRVAVTRPESLSMGKWFATEVRNFSSSVDFRVLLLDRNFPRDCGKHADSFNVRRREPAASRERSNQRLGEIEDV